MYIYMCLPTHRSRSVMAVPRMMPAMERENLYAGTDSRVQVWERLSFWHTRILREREPGEFNSALLLATWLLRIARIRSKTTFKTFYFKPKMNSERMWCFAYMMKASELLSHHSAPQSKAVSVAGKMSIQLKTCAVYGSRGEHFFKPGEYGNPHTRVLPRAPRTW